MSDMDRENKAAQDAQDSGEDQEQKEFVERKRWIFFGLLLLQNIP